MRHEARHLFRTRARGQQHAPAVQVVRREAAGCGNGTWARACVLGSRPCTPGLSATPQPGNLHRRPENCALRPPHPGPKLLPIYSPPIE